MLKYVCLLAVLALSSASDVIDLTDANFKDELLKHEVSLVEFFAPWCGHCKRLAPEYEKAATALVNNDPPITLAKVDCTGDGKASCDANGVSGFPTLKIFRKADHFQDYNGPREADGIVKYMKSKAGPSSRELKTVAETERFLSNDEQGVVGFFTAADNDIASQFKKLADSLNEDHRFAHTTNKDILAKYGYSDDVVIFQPKRLQNKFEEGQLKYDGDTVQHKLKSWTTDNIHGLCGHRTSGNAVQFKKPLVVAYYDVDYVKNTKGTNYWRNRVMKVGKKLQDEGKKVYFAVSSKDEMSYELSEFGMDTTTDKPLIAARDASDQKYVMKEEFSMDNLEKFVNDFLDGKLKPYLKSEPIPDSNDEPVKVVVAEEFNKIVNDETKDVLIEFYAPWCGHCKTLAPKYDELAEKLKNEDDIVIAKMDATANDVPAPYKVSGFPTLYFSPKGSKNNPKKYEGGREVNDFIKYLARESTDELNGYGRDGKKKKSKKNEL